MATLDEINKEKQRLGEALIRVDAQREKLVSQLSELEATERVLARYSTGTQPRKMASARMPTAGAKAAGRRRSPTTKSAGSRNSPTSRALCAAHGSGARPTLTATRRTIEPAINLEF